MNPKDKVTINRLSTGIPGLDEIIGGGFPEFSFNIIAGAPGSGKTTLAHQFVFANATPERPALYFTVLGEPALKMLRYQQQYTFFDSAKLNNSVGFIDLSQVVLEKDLDALFEEITREVEKVNPAVVVVDSFRTMVRKQHGEVELQSLYLCMSGRLSVKLLLRGEPRHRLTSPGGRRPRDPSAETVVKLGTATCVTHDRTVA